MTVTTADKFFEVLEKSELLSAAEIDQAREAAKSDDPKAVARHLIRQGRLSRWQAGVLLSGRHQLRLGKYTLVERISSGGLGDVYLARHEQMGRNVAIKTLSRWYTKNPHLIKQFLGEVRNIAKLDHRNIVHVYDIDREGDRYCLVLEHVKGRDLETVVQEDGILQSELVADYIRQAAAGLAHAHEHGILHRNMKPANLLVDKQGCIKILNIGMTRLMEVGPQPEDSFVGKGRFAAPEQAIGEQIDERTDIYSLGATGFYLLTGKLPAQLSKKTKSPLEQLFREMMADEPKDRTQSAQEVVEKLDHWLGENAARAMPTAAIDLDEAIELEAEAKPAPSKKPPVKKAEPLPETESSPFDFNIDTTPKEKVTGAPMIDVGPKSKPAPAKTKSASSEEAVKPAPKSKPPAPPAKKSKSNGDIGLQVDDAVDPLAPIVSQTPEMEVDEQPEDEAQVEPQKKKMPIGLLLGIGGGALALVIVTAAVATVVAMYVFGGSGDGTQVAENKNGTAKANPTPKVTTPKENIDPENFDFSKLGNNNTDTTQTNTDNGTGTDAVPPDAVVPPEAPADVTPPDNKEPMNGGDPNGSEQAPVTPPTTNGEQPKPPTDPNTGPDNPATEVTKPDEAPMPKPEPPKPAPKVLATLPKSIDIPMIPEAGGNDTADFTQPYVLGDMPGEIKGPFGIALAGGKSAVRGSKSFSLERGRGGLARTEFDVFLEGSSDIGSPKANIARVWVDTEDKKLKFQWNKEAARDIEANHFRNCILSLFTGAETHELALRKPMPIDPLAMDLEKGEVSASVVADWLPNSDAVMVEIAELGANFGEVKYDPPERKEFEASRGSLLILPQMGQDKFAIKVESSMGRSVQVKATPLVSYPEKRVPGKYNKKTLEGIVNKLDFDQKRFTAIAAKAPEDIKKLPENQRPAAEQQLTVLKNNLTELSKALTLYRELLGLDQKLNGSKIHIRIFYQAEAEDIAGAYKLVLAESIAEKPAK